MTVFDEWAADDGGALPKGLRIDANAPPTCPHEDVGDGHRALIWSWGGVDHHHRKTVPLVQPASPTSVMGDHFRTPKRSKSSPFDLFRLAGPWARYRTARHHLVISYPQISDFQESLSELLTLRGIRFDCVSVDLITRAMVPPRRHAPEELRSVMSVIRIGRVLNLRSCTVRRSGSDQLAQLLHGNVQLEELRLEGWEWLNAEENRSIAMALRSCHNLKLISFRLCAFAPGVFRNLMAQWQPNHHNTKLQVFNVSFCNLNDADIVTLTSNVPTSLRALHLGGNQGRTQATVDTLAHALRSSALTDLNVRALWTNFDNGSVRRTVELDELLAAIRTNSRLTHLNMAENRLRTPDIESLCASILGRTDDSDVTEDAPCCPLISLDASNNPFDEPGAEALLNVAQTIPTVLHLRSDSMMYRYECSGRITVATYHNWWRTQVARLQKAPPTVWPEGIVQVHSLAQERYKAISIPDVLFRMSTAPAGECGVPYLVYAAMISASTREGSKEKKSYNF